MADVINIHNSNEDNEIKRIFETLKQINPLIDLKLEISEDANGDLLYDIIDYNTIKLYRKTIKEYTNKIEKLTEMEEGSSANLFFSILLIEIFRAVVSTIAIPMPSEKLFSAKKMLWELKRDAFIYERFEYYKNEPRLLCLIEDPKFVKYYSFDFGFSKEKMLISLIDSGATYISGLEYVIRLICSKGSNYNIEAILYEQLLADSNIKLPIKFCTIELDSSEDSSIKIDLDLTDNEDLSQFEELRTQIANCDSVMFENMKIDKKCNLTIHIRKVSH